MDNTQPKKRAMSSQHASEVKIAGHKNEEDFARIIGGEVNRGSHTDKKDVIDTQHRSHSVKAGEWWQIFLYGRNRLANNTILQGIGDVASIMVQCLDVYPENRDEYKKNKDIVKQKLQPVMRDLLHELQKRNIFRAFLDKSMFDGGNAEYLSIFLGEAKENVKNKQFHIFYKDDVVDAIEQYVDLKNSKARNATQSDDQKIIFYSTLHNRNIGEIEDRHESRLHYKQMKFRLRAQLVYDILQKHCGDGSRVSSQIVVYGIARKKFQLP